MLFVKGLELACEKGIGLRQAARCRCRGRNNTAYKVMMVLFKLKLHYFDFLRCVVQQNSATNL